MRGLVLQVLLLLQHLNSAGGVRILSLFIIQMDFPTSLEEVVCVRGLILYTQVINDDQ